MPKKPAHVENYCAKRAMVEELLSDLKAGCQPEGRWVERGRLRRSNARGPDEI
jgi:hypothetical protein